ncbi:vWA domain-containing protein [Neobacillus bataviensis]|uniref:vWA domain-containing protein n=1 Tax=Neobacillus bataviensis TaxID=220685 RepID=UPI001CBFFF0A|nr:VWA domain-containing protein [Neobacillus bataviensis]
MNLNNFVVQEARPLPVFLLVDTSGSMSIDSKMDTVNVALKEMLQVLSNLEGTKGQIKLSIITFGEKVEVIQPLENVETITLRPLVACGQTPMGGAIEKVIEMIEDRSIVPSRAYTPTVVLISDGKPTDCPPGIQSNTASKKEEYLDWDPIYKFHNSERTKKSSNLALGVGKDADFEMLKAFTNKENVPVIKAKDTATIAKFFKWVTMSVSMRSVSVNPNDFDDIPFDDVFGSDELVY